MLMKRRPAPEPEPPRRQTPLEFYGARLLPPLHGWWVYALEDRARPGVIFYVGASEKLVSRLRDHSYAYPERYDPERVWLIPVDGQAQADLVELSLIDHYQPECNTLGRREELQGRLRSRNRGFAPGHRYSPGAKPLDSKQATG
jgi:hypothetical protein